MRRVLLAIFLIWPLMLRAQEAIPVLLGQTITMLSPASDATGQTIVFGSAVTTDGANLSNMDLYTVAADGSGLRRLTKLAFPNGFRQPQGANAISLSANAAKAAFTVIGPTGAATIVPPPGPGGEEVHLVDVSTGADRIVAVDTQGCIQPLAAICLGCFFTCVNTPHISPDGNKILYSVRRNQPFYSVNSDGTGLTNLPVFSGSLAPSPQRVISRNELVVFTSSVLSGPTTIPVVNPAVVPVLVAPATDVYVMNLDGTNIQNATNFGNNTSLFASNATISADGSVIAFESNRDPITGAAGQINQIWRVNAGGGSLLPLTNGTDPSSSPSISADGSMVAFVRNGQIWVASFRPFLSAVGSRALTNFALSDARDPVISEDGSMVAFAIGPQNGGNGAIYSLSTASANPHSVYAPRALNPNGIIGVSFGVSPSPGSLFSAYGLNLAPDSVTAATSFPLPQTLAGVSLLVNGVPAPLLAVTPWQVNAQLPSDLPQGPAAFQFRFADGTSPAAGAADVQSLAPAIFLLPPVATPCPTGTVCISDPFVATTAAVFHGNSAVPVDQAHPAAAGEVLVIYGTGLGTTNPFLPAGLPAPSSPPARTTAPPQVLFGTALAQVTFAGLTPGLAGVYQVNAVVPAGLRSGAQNLQWKIGTIASNPVTIWVQ